jgi:hypothetical protein
MAARDSCKVRARSPSHHPGALRPHRHVWVVGVWRWRNVSAEGDKVSRVSKYVTRYVTARLPCDLDVLDVAAR